MYNENTVLISYRVKTLLFDFSSSETVNLPPSIKIGFLDVNEHIKWTHKMVSLKMIY